MNRGHPSPLLAMCAAGGRPWIAGKAVVTLAVADSRMEMGSWLAEFPVPFPWIGRCPSDHHPHVGAANLQRARLYAERLVIDVLGSPPAADQGPVEPVSVDQNSMCSYDGLHGIEEV